jgi:ribosome-binding protein aMBF1 (putative translation factor)
VVEKVTGSETRATTFPASQASSPAGRSASSSSAHTPDRLLFPTAVTRVRDAGRKRKDYTKAEEKFAFDVMQQVRERRVIEGISQEEMAEKVGLSVMMESRRERGKCSITLEDLARYARVLGCEVVVELRKRG